MTIKRLALPVSFFFIFLVSPLFAGYVQNSFNQPVDFLGGIQWVGIPIKISSAPVDAKVTSIDVHCEISPDFGFLYVTLSDEFEIYDHTLIDGQYTGGDHVSETFTNITNFNSMPVNQTWILWVAEYYAYDLGQLDSWWIKVYYDDGSVTTYCNSGGGCEEYIYRFQAGTIDNESDCNGYADYSNISTQMQIGKNYPAAVINGNPYTGDLCGIWVDWNQDLDFDDPCESIEVSGNPQVFAALISPPPDANLGPTKLRVRITYGQPPNPCGEDWYGEVEDYTVIVTPAKIAGDLLPPDGVDYRDFSVLASAWLSYPGAHNWNPECDLSQPQVIYFEDISAMAQNWLCGKTP